MSKERRGICPNVADPSNSDPIQPQTDSEYDRLARQYGYVFPDALFGLCFEYLQPGQRLLDIGIGTGLSALPFTRAGIEIYGMDNSQELLSICKARSIAVELKRVDICVKPWPYSDNFFDHVIACGVTHFIPDLEPIFQEVSRLARPKGIFAFTIKTPQNDVKVGANQGKYITEMIEGVQIFSHYRTYYEAMLSSSGFIMRKQLKFLLTRGAVDQDDLYTACIAQKPDS